MVVSSYFDHTNTNTLNFGYDINSNTGGWVNYKGYQGGTTQFRDFMPLMVKVQR